MPAMKRDELVKALEAEPSNAEVQVCIGAHLVDVESVAFMEKRDSIVIHMRSDDISDVMNASRNHFWIMQ